MNLDCGKGLSAKCPRPKEILDLSYWNTSDDMVRKAHDIWSETYEQDMITSGFQSPDVLVSELQKATESTFSVVGKEALKILDIGAGTGMIGEKLVARGFTNLEAIDLSPKMLAIAEKKNLYQRMVCDSLYNWRQHFNAGQFDIALSCSVFTPGQLKPNAFDEIICLVKPGGLMAHSMREDAYSTVEYGYESKLKQLEEEGKIKLLTRERTVRYTHKEANSFTVPYAFILVYQVIKHD
ncbi:methyltransferase-like protein 27 [Oculina patagonica]